MLMIDLVFNHLQKQLAAQQASFTKLRANTQVTLLSSNVTSDTASTLYKPLYFAHHSTVLGFGKPNTLNNSRRWTQREDVTQWGRADHGQSQKLKRKKKKC